MGHIYIFSICGFGIGCVFLLQIKTRNLREVEWSIDQNIHFQEALDAIQLCRRRVYKSDNHFLVFHSVYKDYY